MRMMLIDENNMFVSDSYGQILLNKKPAFGFDYIWISYSEKDRTKWVVINDEVVEAALEQHQIEEIEYFITSTRQQYGIKVMAVDADGFYLGLVDKEDPRISQQVKSSPPNDDDWRYGVDGWERVYCFDADGHLIRKAAPTYSGYTTKPYPQAGNRLPYRFSQSENAWVCERLSDEQWKKLIRHEILFITLSQLFNGAQAIASKLGDESKSQEYLKGLLESALSFSIKFADENSDSPEMQTALREVNTELQKVLLNHGQDELIKTQEAVYLFKNKIDQSLGNETQSENLNLMDIVLDQYVAK